ncbi:ComF family protein [Streptomyces sp. NPDC090445]|uniref:ComF family protein n=1 Tax=Streptomyces sp. NPDC090445 TaxID=3365963 RepID=UPI003802FBDA
MRGWWQELAGLVLPGACAGCGEPRAVLCAACGRALDGGAAGPVRPSRGPRGLPPVYGAAVYEGAVRAVVLAHKERGALALAGPLGAALAAAVAAAAAAAGAAGGGAAGPGEAGPGAVGPGAAVVLVPVPSAPRQVRARGHDPVRRIALAAAGRLRRAGVPARVASVLRQVRPVADQAGLGARERRANLAGALAVYRGGARSAAGARIVLVDDVITTGATLAEAARALGAAGAGPVAGAAVVAAPPGSFVRIRSSTRTEQHSCE